jgi:hypothetical protein
MKKVLTEKRGVFKEFDKKMSFLLNLSWNHWRKTIL